MNIWLDIGKTAFDWPEAVMLYAFIIWVIAVAAVAIFGQGPYAGVALGILGGCGGMLAFGRRFRG